MSLFKNLSVQLIMINSSQNFYCFLPLAPILLLLLAACLVSGFVATMHQSPLGVFLGMYLTVINLIFDFEVHTLDLIETQTSQCFGSRAHWIGLGSSKTWIPLQSPGQAHSAAVDKSYLCTFGINFQTIFRLRSLIPMCLYGTCYTVALISLEVTDV